jgi:hypothetical protein
MEGMGGEEEILKILDIGLGNFVIYFFVNTAESGKSQLFNEITIEEISKFPNPKSKILLIL